jgi:hypothetical protein
MEIRKLANLIWAGELLGAKARVSLNSGADNNEVNRQLSTISFCSSSLIFSFREPSLLISESDPSTVGVDRVG